MRLAGFDTRYVLLVIKRSGRRGIVCEDLLYLRGIVSGIVASFQAFISQDINSCRIRSRSRHVRQKWLEAFAMLISNFPSLWLLKKYRPLSSSEYITHSRLGASRIVAYGRCLFVAQNGGGASGRYGSRHDPRLPRAAGGAAEALESGREVPLEGGCGAPPDGRLKRDSVGARADGMRVRMNRSHVDMMINSIHSW